MPLDPSALPLLLAGPILRRVESDLVSGWIATSRSCDVSLWLYVGGDVVASENPFHDPRAAWVSRPQRTLQVGANLHVLTVVLDLRIPDGNAERSSSATLDANHPYSYDLQLLDRTLTELNMPGGRFTDLLPHGLGIDAAVVDEGLDQAKPI